MPRGGPQYFDEIVRRPLGIVQVDEVQIRFLLVIGIVSRHLCRYEEGNRVRFIGGGEAEAEGNEAVRLPNLLEMGFVKACNHLCPGHGRGINDAGPLTVDTLEKNMFGIQTGGFDDLLGESDIDVLIDIIKFRDLLTCYKGHSFCIHSMID